MLRITELRLPLNHAEDALRPAIVARLGVADTALSRFNVFKRAYDARKKSAIVLIYTVDCELAPEADEATVLQKHAGDPHIRPSPDTSYRFVGHVPADYFAADTAAGGKHRPLVVGFGPCGIFAALILAQMGLRPIVLERGKEVRQRTKDTWGLWRQQQLNPESNVQFGEGGAGTFSDGKLWSQISDPRHLTRKVLAEFVKAGAPDEILYVSKPHIGTFRLVSMVEKIRADIVALGGEIRFEQRVTDVLIEGKGEQRHIRGVTLASGETLRADHVVMALGHSARDTFTMLHERGVYMEAKPFSIGFRVEHPQGVIDRARFGPNAGHPILGAADYKLVHHASNGRSVYSFCMCPGGTVVAATSEPERVVTNGMSQYSRNERNANAGIVVGIDPADYRQLPGSGPVNPLDGMAFQRVWESRAYELGGGGYLAPGALVGDFIKRQPSRTLGSVEPSYKPGVHLTELAAKDRPVLPHYVLDAIREALPAFERQIKGFSMPDAVLTGVETRTSSPLRMTRGKDHQSLNVKGLFPAGEGAGYAGGIMSAGVDGIEVAEAVGRAMLATA
ncbi:MAG TPA: NAD(P)/FAD-dependent oxidoreductase [Ideonella sp.]|uniref:NAD(P)/FAD-dependent oxidoreductase n=1 Tax=Ideonella sp. TaxID=1929293 RepID=UPI002BB31534|nr:NAD(P)/FAD-dependent oxidoreductase [Ideonella sp.]HSI51008.1 NAD(P)/FAD-dependent oxidoreductase [Ideonella sp.]